MNVTMQVLWSILKATPQLTSLSCRATSLCHEDDLLCFVNLNERCLAAIIKPPSILLESAVEGSFHKDDDIGMFVSKLPILPAFTCLTACGCFHDNGIRHLVRVFPFLVTLKLLDPTGLTDCSVRLLVGLTQLRSLEIDSSKQLTDEGVLAVMCLRPLKRLRLIRCKLVSDDVSQQAAGWGGLVIEVQQPLEAQLVQS